MERVNQTLNEAVDSHRKLWHGIAEHIRNNGVTTWYSHWLKRAIINDVMPEFKDIYVPDNCFLCAFTITDVKNQYRDCNKCPMVKKEPNDCLNGLFDLFCHALKNKEKGLAIKFAEQIAELPVINPLYRKDGADEPDTE